jgi:hypothetical protein
VAQFKQKQKRKRRRDTKRIARIVAILVVFGLIAAFFIGTIGTVSAQAAALTCVQDVDADGQLNAVDPDIDGDGVVNAEDDDMDGDGINNFKDQDPAATNCTTDAPLPIKPAVVDNSATLYIGLTAAGIAIAAPAAYVYAKRRKRK